MKKTPEQIRALAECDQVIAESLVFAPIINRHYDRLVEIGEDLIGGKTLAELSVEDRVAIYACVKWSTGSRDCCHLQDIAGVGGVMVDLQPGEKLWNFDEEE